MSRVRFHGGSRAFTLVELLLVLAIMGVIAAIAAPRYAASIANYHADFPARRLASDLALARASARANSSSRTVSFNTGASSYAISGMAALDARPGGYSVSLPAAPYESIIKTLTFSDGKNDGQLVFNGFGAPDSGATITIGCGSFQRVVSVDASTGVASVQ